MTPRPLGRPISMRAYDALWAGLFPGQPKPLVLDGLAVGVTREERLRLHQQGQQELATSDYAWQGVVAPDVRQALDVLHNPISELSMRCADLRAMAAGRVTAGALGLIRDDRFELAWMDGAFLAEALLSLLPGHRAAPVHWQHSIQEGTLADAGTRLRSPDGPAQSYEAILTALRDSGTPANTADLIARLTTEQFVRRAEFSGATWTRDGRQRSARSVVVHDTKVGRYLITRTAGTMQVTGADEARIIDELRQLVGQSVVRR